MKSCGTTGRLFHVAGIDTAKFRRPIVVLVRGTTSVPLSPVCRPHLPTTDDRRNRDGPTHRSRTAPDRERHLKVIIADLKVKSLAYGKSVVLTQHWSKIVIKLPCSGHDSLNLLLVYTFRPAVTFYFNYYVSFLLSAVTKLSFLGKWHEHLMNGRTDHIIMPIADHIGWSTIG